MPLFHSHADMWSGQVTRLSEYNHGVFHSHPMRHPAKLRDSNPIPRAILPNGLPNTITGYSIPILCAVLPNGETPQTMLRVTPFICLYANLPATRQKFPNHIRLPFTVHRLHFMPPTAAHKQIFSHRTPCSLSYPLKFFPKPSMSDPFFTGLERPGTCTISTGLGAAAAAADSCR